MAQFIVDFRIVLSPKLLICLDLLANRESVSYILELSTVLIAGLLTWLCSSPFIFKGHSSVYKKNSIKSVCLRQLLGLKRKISLNPVVMKSSYIKKDSHLPHMYSTIAMIG